MSNYPPPGMPPGAYPQTGYSAPPPPQPSGCGCGGCLGKFFILLGVVFFVMIVVCGGGGALIYRSLKTGTVYQPAEVQTIGDEITPMRVPAPLQPVAGGRYTIPFVKEPLGQGAVFAAPNKKAVLIVASLTDKLGPQFKDKMLKGLTTGPNQQGASENDDLNEELKDVKEVTVERTIRGEPAKFRIIQGVGVKSGTKKIRVSGGFQGKTGPAILIIMGEEATLSREKVDRIIQSIDGGAKAEEE